MLASVGLPAQSIEPRARFVVHHDAARACLQVSLDPEPTPLKKAWKAYINDHFNVKLDGIGFLTNKDILSAENVTMSQISSRKIYF